MLQYAIDIANISFLIIMVRCEIIYFSFKLNYFVPIAWRFFASQRKTSIKEVLVFTPSNFLGQIARYVIM